MSAEAIARLRAYIEHQDKQPKTAHVRWVDPDFPPPTVKDDDLRALLDAHAALEVEAKKARQAGITETYYLALKALNDGSNDLIDLQVATHALKAERDEALAALEAAHAEALDALEPLYRKNKLREGYCRDATCPHCNELRAAEAVLAKAGRR